MAIPPTPSLGRDFPLPTLDDWRRAVDQVLAKGADLTPEELDERFRKQLVSTLDAGIELQPLYTAADVDPALLAATGLPGFPPFVRGSSPGSDSGWEVRQEVRLDTADPSSTARQVVHELERGATGVLLRVDPETVVTVDLLDAALAEVYLELVPVALTGVSVSSPAAEALVELWHRRGIGSSDARGTLGCDPVGDAARLGGSMTDIGTSWDAVAALARRCATDLPHVRAVVVDGLPYHEAGASDAEELGCLLAAGVAALRALTERGLTVDQAFAQVELRVAATADQFVTIAKLRALRSLWNRVGEVSGASPQARAPKVHAVTSPVMLTRYDAWVNLLRNTVACFAAGVGGADAVTVAPHDAALAPAAPSDLSRRLARNTQAILTDESNLARVIDAAGGSWYVESLTDAVAEAAWSWFQEIEAAGGATAALAAGLVHERLSATWARRLDRLAHRAEPITGVSEFPLLAEEVPPPSVVHRATVAGDVSPLPVVRRAEEFERLRTAADEHTRRTGHRPVVLLAGLGTAADHNARSGFAMNLFEAGGLRTVLVEGATSAQLAAAVAEHGATVACLCSSDARYPELLPAAAAALKAAGVSRLYLAGRAGEHAEAWRAAGVDEEIFVGCHVIEVLTRLHEVLGIDASDASDASEEAQ
jgi:methylmalonyl-CoA mutase